ncbi:MAG: hypothetical protein OXF02_01965 [Simkaniaceae bacterium]|nr:hypothetical protein [Simkaniaceae bacterium]
MSGIGKKGIIGLLVASVHLPFFLIITRIEQSTGPKRPITVLTHRIPSPEKHGRTPPPGIVTRGSRPKQRSNPKGIRAGTKPVRMDSAPRKQGEPPLPRREDPMMLPRAIGALHIDRQENREEGKGGIAVSDEYLALLSDALRKHLTLPEKGSVRLCLSVTRTGSVEKIEVLYAEGSSNAEYLKTRLPGIRFPPFPDGFGEIKQCPFTLYFENE